MNMQIWIFTRNPPKNYDLIGLIFQYSFFSPQDLFDDSNLCILEASLESKRTLPILGTSLPYLSPKVVLFSFFSLVLFANSVKL